MPRPPRVLFEGAFYHIYNRGVEKRPIYFSEFDKNSFLKVLANVAAQFKLEIYAYCLMDNHYHLFIQTQEANLSQAIQMLQGRYAQSVNLKYERVGPLFQGRYKSRLVQAEAYALTLTRYIHQNASLSYPWSSYGFYRNCSKTPHWLKINWILSQFHEDSDIALKRFEEFHDLKSPEAELKVLKRMRQRLGNHQKGVRPLFGAGRRKQC